MKKIARLRPLLAMCALVGTPLNAFETDQYLVWEQGLADSTDRINAFVNEQSVRVLERIHPSDSAGLTCEEVPNRIYRRVFGNLLWSRVRRFVGTDAEIDRYPDGEIGYRKYLKQSIFRKLAFPFFLPLARTVRVNGVNLGADKLGHMFGFGRRYYVRYHRLRRRGLAEEEALLG